MQVARGCGCWGLFVGFVCFFQELRFSVQLTKYCSSHVEKHQVHKGALREQFLVFHRTKV